jgi:hypothetical protein
MDDRNDTGADWEALLARDSQHTENQENQSRAAWAATAADAMAYETRGDWSGWDNASPEEQDEVLRDLSGNLRWLALDRGLDPDRIEEYGRAMWSDELDDTAAEVDGPVLVGFHPTDEFGGPDPVTAPRLEAWKTILTALEWPGQSAAQSAWSEDSLTAVAATAVAVEVEYMNFMLAEEALEIGGDEAHFPRWNTETGRIVNAVTGDHAVALPVNTAAIVREVVDAVKSELPDLEVRTATAEIARLTEAARRQQINVRLLTGDHHIEEAKHSVPVIYVSNHADGFRFELNPSMRAVEELKALIEGRSFADKVARAGVSTIAAFPIRVADRLTEADTAAAAAPAAVREAEAAQAAER